MKLRYLAPSLFTVGNMACGFFSLLAVSHQDYSTAAWLILSAVLLDALDGSVARLVKAESLFGMEFDSLADWVSFGIAPACMMYGFVLKDYGPAGKSIAFLYALCGALRLARFNLHTQSGQSIPGHFTGLPIPAGAGMLSSFILLYTIIEQDRPARTIKPLMDQVPTLYLLIPLFMLAIAALMVSKIPYRAFKQPDLLRPRSPKQLMLIVAGFLLVYLYPHNAIFIFFCAYILSGLAVKVKKAFTGHGSSDGQQPHSKP